LSVSRRKSADIRGGGAGIDGLLDRWPGCADEAIALQRQLAGQVRIEPLSRPVELVAGIDVAVLGRRWQQSQMIAGVVVYELSSDQVIEKASSQQGCRFPYVPGLLSFREAPAVLEAVAKLRCRPDVFMLDGQGMAHPRRFGLASHVGVLVDRPTIGCAKSRLVGQQRGVLGVEAGSRCPLVDGEEVIGAVVRTRRGVKPVFVSVGHRVTLEDAVNVVLGCCRGVRLPQPTRFAHQYVQQQSRRRCWGGGGAC